MKKPIVAVDALVVNHGKILLIKRRFAPFKNFYALPGGFVKYGEKVEDALVREVKEETGVKIKVMSLFNVYSEPKRDPRAHVISITFLARPIKGKPKPCKETVEARWFSLVNALRLKLAFDHRKILLELRRLKRF